MKFGTVVVTAIAVFIGFQIYMAVNEHKKPKVKEQVMKDVIFFTVAPDGTLYRRITRQDSKFSYDYCIQTPSMLNYSVCYTRAGVSVDKDGSVTDIFTGERVSFEPIN